MSISTALHGLFERVIGKGEVETEEVEKLLKELAGHLIQASAPHIERLTASIEATLAAHKNWLAAELAKISAEVDAAVAKVAAEAEAEVAPQTVIFPSKVDQDPEPDSQAEAPAEATPAAAPVDPAPTTEVKDAVVSDTPEQGA